MGAPIIDVSQPINVDNTPAVRYEFKNNGQQKVRLREISIMWDSNFTVNGKWTIEIKGKRITSQNQPTWITPLQSTMGFSLDLSDMNIILNYNDNIRFYAQSSTASTVQVAVIGEVVE